MKPELITWRGTPGVGDFMWALNSAHNFCWAEKTTAILELHWEHGEDYIHHPDEEETIIERMAFIHNFYHRKDDVEVVHVFNADSRYKHWKYADDIIKDEDGNARQVAKNSHGEKARFYFDSGKYSDEIGGKIPDNNWVFRDDIVHPRKENKIVIWRPTFNAEIPRTWKRGLTNAEWDDIISMLRGQGFNVVELTYRTPVSEAFYEISTCRLVLCYDGMWHYIARNFSIPMIVISKDGVTKYHTPHAITASGLKEDNYNIWWYLKDIAEFLGIPRKYAMEHKHRSKKYYEVRD